MKKLNAIIGKEWAGFLGSERGVFSVYGILVLSWSFLPLYKGLGTGPIWWLFFSVVISGNFTNTVFVSERLSGSMELPAHVGFFARRGAVGKIDICPRDVVRDRPVVHRHIADLGFLVGERERGRGPWMFFTVSDYIARERASTSVAGRGCRSDCKVPGSSRLSEYCS